MNNRQQSPTAPRWVGIPNGTKVRHRHQGYDGHIDGLTEMVIGSNRNPDGKTQYRLNIGGSTHRLVTEDDLSILIDGDGLVNMRSSEDFERPACQEIHFDGVM